MKYSFIKSKLKMIDELNYLWDNQELLRFFQGMDIRERELEICECIPNIEYERDYFIEMARTVWIFEQEKKKGL